MGKWRRGHFFVSSFFFFPALPLLFRILFPLLLPALPRENVSGPEPKFPGITSQNRNKF